MPERLTKIAQVNRWIGGRAAAEAVSEVALGQSGKGGCGLDGECFAGRAREVARTDRGRAG